MTYSEQLRPWCIIRVLPDQEQLIVARFRRQVDAIAYSQVLQGLYNTAKFLITFETPVVTNQ